MLALEALLVLRRDKGTGTILVHKSYFLEIYKSLFIYKEGSTSHHGTHMHLKTHNYTHTSLQVHGVEMACFCLNVTIRLTGSLGGKLAHGETEAIRHERLV